MAAMIYHEMPGIKVYRIVQTKKGTGIVTSFNRTINQIDVATSTQKMYGLRYDEMEVNALVLKKIK